MHVAFAVLDEAKFHPKTGERPAGFLGEKVTAALPTPQDLFINCSFMQPEP
jgi:hypothetical protein